MAGTIVLNFAVGAAAFVFTFLSAVFQNVWSVSLWRAFIAFLVFFIATYIVRWLISLFASPAVTPDVGNHVDLATPEAGEHVSQSAEAESELAESFSPFQPPRLDRTEVEEDPDKIANIIRRLADE
ncbi:UNVERIFIED_CONTAM: flagellar biosynthesis/type III secretory pathway M-ring protein FliF/YscJ [Brevibacillus sp. OAP136]